MFNRINNKVSLLGLHEKKVLEQKLIESIASLATIIPRITSVHKIIPYSSLEKMKYEKNALLKNVAEINHELEKVALKLFYIDRETSALTSSLPPRTLQQTIDDLKAEVASLGGEVRRLKNELSETRTTLNANITTLTTEKAKRDQSIRALEAKLDAAVKDKSKSDTEISELRKQISAAKEAYAKAERDVESFREAQQDLETQNAKKDAQIAEMQEQILERNRQVAELLRRLVGEA
jgi:chromosome segregation ATPase